MKFHEMEVGKEYRIIFGKDNTSVSKYRINDDGDVEADTGVWHKTNLAHLKLYNCNFEEIEREIDWDKVPQWTKIQVLVDGGYANRYLRLYDDEAEKVLACVCDEFTDGKHFLGCWFKHFRLHESVEIKEEWYK
ncbi:MAG: hypothetical protein ACRCVJ_11770 [Clostridium sp.]|uniref:hypothetical protein n=1 Tax=Clostridium sp. TaxID=1506 RepID=UPI003F2D042C